ncbi:MAG: hypothetical protein ABSH53_13660 [Holophaga sp.]|jgi:hypothetical protein
MNLGGTNELAMFGGRMMVEFGMKRMEILTLAVAGVSTWVNIVYRVKLRKLAKASALKTASQPEGQVDAGNVAILTSAPVLPIKSGGVESRDVPSPLEPNSSFP